VIENIGRKISMRVDNRNSAPGFDVLKNHVPEECGFAAPAHTNRVNMMPAIRARKTERFRRSPNVTGSQSNVLVHTHPSPYSIEKTVGVFG
jgi:hypothetical protein